MTRRIYMTGVMSSGKTSIASGLAKHFVGSLYKEEINETLLSNTFQKKNPDGNLALLTQLDFLIKLVSMEGKGERTTSITVLCLWPS